MRGRRSLGYRFWAVKGSRRRCAFLAVVRGGEGLICLRLFRSFDVLCCWFQVFLSSPTVEPTHEEDQRHTQQERRSTFCAVSSRSASGEQGDLAAAAFSRSAGFFLLPDRMNCARGEGVQAKLNGWSGDWARGAEA